MQRIIKKILMGMGMAMQLATVLMAAFTSLPVSGYAYTLVWILCGLLIRFSMELAEDGNL